MATQVIDIVARDRTAQALNSIQRQLSGIQGQVGRMNSAFGGLASAAVGVFAGLGLGRVARDIVNTGRRFEDLRAQLRTVTGSAANATAAFNRIQEFASTTPFQVDELTSAFIILQRNGIDTTTQALTEFGNVAAANGKSIEQFAEAVADATVGEFERLKEFGIRVAKENEQFVVTLADGSRRVVDSTQQVVEAVRELGAEGGRFGQGIENRAKTLSGAISNFQDSVDAVNDAIGQSGLNMVLRDTFIAMGDLINQARPLAEEIGFNLAVQVQKFNNFLQDVDLRSFAAGIATITQLVGAAGMTAAIFRAVGAIRALTLAIAANPIGFLITAVTTLLAYLAFDNGLGKTLTQIVAVMNKVGEIFSAVGSYLGSIFAGVIDWIKEKFYNFIDAIIDGYNAIAEWVPGLEAVEKTGRDVAAAMGGMVVEGFNAVSTAIDDVVDSGVGYLQQNETIRGALDTVNGALSDVTSAWTIAGEQYDQANEAVATQVREQQALEAALAEQTDAARAATAATTQQSEAAEQSAKSNRNLREEIEKLQEKYTTYLQNTVELAEREYGRDITIFQQALNQKLISQEEYNRLVRAADAQLFDTKRQFEQDLTALTLQEIEKRTAAQVAAGNYMMAEEDRMLLRRAANSQKLQELQRKQTENLINYEKDRVGFIVGSLADSLSAFKDHNRAAFKAWKAFAIAQAIGDTYRSATAAYASLAVIPFVGPILGAAAAAAAIAVGIARVNQIRSLQYTGYAQGGEMTVNKPSVVGENGPEIIVPKNPSVVMPNSVKERLGMMGGGSGPVTVNFNITTLDARDFDSMLIDRRATITGIINDAMQRRGRVGVY